MPPIAAVIAIKEVSAPHCTALVSSTLDAVLVGWNLHSSDNCKALTLAWTLIKCGLLCSTCNVSHHNFYEYEQTDDDGATSRHW